MLPMLRTVSSARFSNSCWLVSSSPLVVQTKNTYVLKRRWPPGLTKKGRRPVLHARNYVYDLIEDTSTKKRQSIDVILTSYVTDVGDIGDRVSVSPNVAYYKLLLGRKAVYASPEIEKQYDKLMMHKEAAVKKFSSLTAEKTITTMSKMYLSVTMNKEMDWVLQPWHIRASFRKAGIIVPESAIEMPSQLIEGPNLTMENKEFYITVKVNGTESVPVACRIHHWSTQVGNRLPCEEESLLKPTGSLFPAAESQALPDEGAS